jgi:hypothetical protein
MEQLHSCAYLQAAVQCSKQEERGISHTFVSFQVGIISSFLMIESFGKQLI